MIDANIIGRYFNTDDDTHKQTLAALASLRQKDHRLVYTPQIEAEFASFASRAQSSNGFGLSSSEVEVRLDQMQGVFSLRIPDGGAQRDAFRQLRRELGVTGHRVHDLRIVASCRALNIGAVLTYDHKGFAKAQNAGHIEILNPAQVIQTGSP